ELDGRSLEPVHFPVARDQGAARRIGHRNLAGERLAEPETARQRRARGSVDVLRGGRPVRIFRPNRPCRPLIPNTTTGPCFGVFTEPLPIGSAAALWACCWA